MSLRKKAGSVSKKYLGEKRTRVVKALLVRGEPSRHATNKKPLTPNYGDNVVINHPKLDESKIIFKGKGNILYCEDKNITLRECSIIFEGNDSVVYLSSNSYRIHADIRMGSDSVLFTGKNTTFNHSLFYRTALLAQEHHHIIIGNDALFSHNCFMRTTDSHSMYDASTKERLNLAKSILIGDHVWVGQETTILKGTQIGSGAIIGARSLVTGKKLSSNTSFGGTPARKIREGVFFTKNAVAHHTSKDTPKTLQYPDDNYIYSNDKQHAITLEIIDKHLSVKGSNKKLKAIQDLLVNSQSKNRFYIGSD